MTTERTTLACCDTHVWFAVKSTAPTHTILNVVPAGGEQEREMLSANVRFHSNEAELRPVGRRRRPTFNPHFSAEALNPQDET